ncbi:MAG: mannose-1-phosphate guanylyltransferase, partial [Oscillospiraceae bacterium]|nr:mannose-1-phosphate guanylyltransferase [Oscillospiraceae bacterium]
MERYGVIMAGGGGTRFWPLSRNACPKQLLNLTGKDKMINETLDRMGLCIAGKNMYVVTNALQAEALARAVGPRVLPEHILAEPSARNTAACIGYAAMEILKKRGDGILCVAPSDAYIKNWPEFARVLETAIAAAETEDKLVTIGIAPTFAATGYGYIRFEKEGNAPARKVLEFKEKPDAETAQRYLESGEYAWNSGMFIWKASVILESIRRFIPDVYEPLCRIGEAMGTP